MEKCKLMTDVEKLSYNHEATIGETEGKEWGRQRSGLQSKDS